MKVIAFYLPQFHTIPENDLWWGKGFTEWVNVKNAKPLYTNHNQPRIPLNENYYNLLNNEIKEWQVSIAHEYGIYGFCFYHYWFNGKLLLEKPVEQFLHNKELDIHYCLCWANEHWTNAWAAQNPTVLIEQEYGREKQWEEHFNYLLQFFKDERYIVENNKPLLVIYRPELIDKLNKMLDYLNMLAIKYGFNGIDFAYQHAGYTVSLGCDESRFTYAIEYHPVCAQVFKGIEQYATIKKIRKKIVTFVENKFGINLREKLMPKVLKHYSYDMLWNYIINMEPRSVKSMPGAFVDWDNTPRKGLRGFVVDGASPQKFEYYMTKQIAHAKNDYKKDMLFIFSWNEWAEGGYLEPDEKSKYGYLLALKKALESNGEFPY